MVVNNLSIYFSKVLTHIVVAAGSNCCCLRVNKRFIQQRQHWITHSNSEIGASKFKDAVTQYDSPRIPTQASQHKHHWCQECQSIIQKLSIMLSYLWHVIIVTNVMAVNMYSLFVHWYNQADRCYVHKDNAGPKQHLATLGWSYS